jgi:NRPS condensation-like uncharacterized protein
VTFCVRVSYIFQAHISSVCNDILSIWDNAVLTLVRHTTHTITMQNDKPTLIRTSLALPKDEFATLKQLATKRHATVSDIVRRAIVLEKLLDDAIANGGKILVEEPDQPVKQLIIR